MMTDQEELELSAVAELTRVAMKLVSLCGRAGAVKILAGAAETLAEGPLSGTTLEAIASLDVVGVAAGDRGGKD